MFQEKPVLAHASLSVVVRVAGADPGFGNWGGGGGKISSEASYIYERRELREKRVRSEASYERSEYESAGSLGAL